MKSKKIVITIILLMFIMLIFTAGCSDKGIITDTEDMDKNNINSIILIENYQHYNIYYDKNTKVQYLFIKRGSGAGLTVMLNTDGTPKLYQEGNNINE